MIQSFLISIFIISLVHGQCTIKDYQGTINENSFVPQNCLTSSTNLVINTDQKTLVFGIDINVNSTTITGNVEKIDMNAKSLTTNHFIVEKKGSLTIIGSSVLSLGNVMMERCSLVVNERTNSVTIKSGILYYINVIALNLILGNSNKDNSLIINDGSATLSGDIILNEVDVLNIIMECNTLHFASTKSIGLRKTLKVNTLLTVQTISSQILFISNISSNSEIKINQITFPTFENVVIVATKIISKIDIVAINPICRNHIYASFSVDCAKYTEYFNPNAKCTVLRLGDSMTTHSYLNDNTIYCPCGSNDEDLKYCNYDFTQLTVNDYTKYFDPAKDGYTRINKIILGNIHVNVVVDSLVFSIIEGSIKSTANLINSNTVKYPISIGHGTYYFNGSFELQKTSNDNSLIFFKEAEISQGIFESIEFKENGIISTTGNVSIGQLIYHKKVFVGQDSSYTKTTVSQVGVFDQNDRGIILRRKANFIFGNAFYYKSYSSQYTLFDGYTSNFEFTQSTDGSAHFACNNSVVFVSINDKYTGDCQRSLPLCCLKKGLISPIDITNKYNYEQGIFQNCPYNGMRVSLEQLGGNIIIAKSYYNYSMILGNENLGLSFDTPDKTKDINIKYISNIGEIVIDNSYFNSYNISQIKKLTVVNTDINSIDTNYLISSGLVNITRGSINTQWYKNKNSLLRSSELTISKMDDETLKSAVIKRDNEIDKSIIFSSQISKSINSFPSTYKWACLDSILILSTQTFNENLCPLIQCTINSNKNELLTSYSYNTNTPCSSTSCSFCSFIINGQIKYDFYYINKGIYLNSDSTLSLTTPKSLFTSSLVITTQMNSVITSVDDNPSIALPSLKIMSNGNLTLKGKHVVETIQCTSGMVIIEGEITLQESTNCSYFIKEGYKLISNVLLDIALYNEGTVIFNKLPKTLHAKLKLTTSIITSVNELHFDSLELVDNLETCQKLYDLTTTSVSSKQEMELFDIFNGKTSCNNAESWICKKGIQWYVCKGNTVKIPEKPCTSLINGIFEISCTLDFSEYDQTTYNYDNGLITNIINYPPNFIFGGNQLNITQLIVSKDLTISKGYSVSIWGDAILTVNNVQLLTVYQTGSSLELTLNNVTIKYIEMSDTSIKSKEPINIIDGLLTHVSIDNDVEIYNSLILSNQILTNNYYHITSGKLTTKECVVMVDSLTDCKLIAQSNVKDAFIIDSMDSIYLRYANTHLFACPDNKQPPIQLTCTITGEGKINYYTANYSSPFCPCKSNECLLNFNDENITELNDIEGYVESITLTPSIKKITGKDVIISQLSMESGSIEMTGSIGTLNTKEVEIISKNLIIKSLVGTKVKITGTVTSENWLITYPTTISGELIVNGTVDLEPNGLIDLTHGSILIEKRAKISFNGGSLNIPNKNETILSEVSIMSFDSKTDIYVDGLDETIFPFTCGKANNLENINIINHRKKSEVGETYHAYFVCNKYIAFGRTLPTQCPNGDLVIDPSQDDKLNTGIIIGIVVGVVVVVVVIVIVVIVIIVVVTLRNKRNEQFRRERRQKKREEKIERMKILKQEKQREREEQKKLQELEEENDLRSMSVGIEIGSYESSEEVEKVINSTFNNDNEKEQLIAKQREEEAKKKAEEEAKKKAEEEARKKAEEEAKKKAEEEARKKAEEEARKKAEEAKKKAEEEARKKAEEARKKAEEESQKDELLSDLEESDSSSESMDEEAQNELIGKVQETLKTKPRYIVDMDSLYPFTKFVTSTKEDDADSVSTQWESSDESK
ncbi:V-type ATP synthase subunit H, putative [Entamoeba histolytica HM-1:IMSS-B]|uniref:V-type ATP synthase subunit H, putative n=1 Tax=Entamoeba histolytica HM-1:IMSS-B TaxID=885319 RepID=M3TFA0_ENTH1|nr:V-type ATP synthase subunit H, putative [Entamoeba histolytica HM-1:IMSS-B]